MTLSVDFRCSNSRDSRIICLHIQNIDLKCSFTFNQCYSLTPDQFRNIFLLLFSGVVSVSCFGVRVSVMFHFMFAHYNLSSVWVAEWPPFGK